MTDRFARTDGSIDAPCDPIDGPYCGGTWRGIIDQLDYIQGMGFDAIYISPVTENLEGKTAYGEAYHGYWPTNIYEINKHFDDYTIAQDCWLGDDQVALPDLNTESQEVSDMINDWAVKLVADYSIDGFRVDAAKHVSDDFLRNFAAAAGIFTIGEVYEGDPNKFCPYQGLMPSMTNYPNYFPMIEAFSAGNISALTRAVPLTKKVCADTNALASFSENHDLPRFPSYTKDMSVRCTTANLI